MKLIINIPDSDYERIKDLVATDTKYTTATTVGTAYQVIANGLPYEKRPQGEWESDDFTVGYTCSVCGSYRVSARVDNFKFCPDCGALMRNGSAE